MLHKANGYDWMHSCGILHVVLYYSFDLIIDGFTHTHVGFTIRENSMNYLSVSWQDTRSS